MQENEAPTEVKGEPEPVVTLVLEVKRVNQALLDLLVRLVLLVQMA